MIPAFEVMLRTQLTRGRAAALGAVGLICVLIGLLIGANERDGFNFVDGFGLGLLVPITSLVFASAAFNDAVEDGTLVYLWLRPVARWRLVLSALAASVCVAIPFAVVPTVLAAGLARNGRELPLAALGASMAATIAYCTIFLGLGLIIRRALVWGLVYVLIWEGFVARSGTSATRLSVLAYARALFAEIAERDPPRLAPSVGAALVIPVVISVVACAVTTFALCRADVR